MTDKTVLHDLAAKYHEITEEVNELEAQMNEVHQQLQTARQTESHARKLFREALANDVSGQLDHGVNFVYLGDGTVVHCFGNEEGELLDIWEIKVGLYLN